MVDSADPLGIGSRKIGYAIDHLTVTDSTPTQLVEVASANGFRAICLFMESMAVLPRMPQFDLYGSPDARRDLRQCLGDSGVALDVAYPFTLSRRAELENFKRGLECAAFLEARFVNVLIYDREEDRRLESFGAFCALADAFGLGVVLEFFPHSAVRSLAEGLDIVRKVHRPYRVGLNVDLLHLVRSGGLIDDLAAAPPDYILYGQFCDGMIACDVATWDHEASSQRMLPGEGQFDLQAFAKALPPACLTSLEIPQEASIVAGVSPNDRAHLAMAAIKTALARR